MHGRPAIKQKLFILALFLLLRLSMAKPRRQEALLLSEHFWSAPAREKSPDTDQ